MILRGLGAMSLIAAALLGCGAPSPTSSRASPIQPDTAFPKAFLEAGPWQETEFVFPPGPNRWPSFDAVLGQVRTYFLAGIRTQGADNGVAIVQTATDPQSQTVSLLVTAIGGANDAVAGRQMTVLVHRDEKGWWIDPKGTDRVYCLRPLAGFARTACVD
jgi:hypothetical protein